MKKLQMPLHEGRFYHIFNRGNNSDTIFYSTENYRFFLRRLDEHLSSFIEVYAFCLLPNHFHLLVRVKKLDPLHLEDAKGLKNDPVSMAFLRLFTSYSKAINKQENRHGSLIENPFKRKEITNTRYLANVVFYIHANPQLHGICDDFRHYPWSSYKRILLSKPSKLKKEEVMKWFISPENYLDYHSRRINLEEIRELIME
jgi:REP element-mobilizing transposase RayT